MELNETELLQILKPCIIPEDMVCLLFDYIKNNCENLKLKQLLTELIANFS